MSLRIALRHRIERRFTRPVRLSTHWLRMRPAPLTHQRLSAYSLGVEGAPHFINWVRDPFENHLARLDLPEPVPWLTLDLEVVADLEPVNPFDFLVEPYAADFPFSYAAQLRKELGPYLALPPGGPRFADWVAGLDVQPGYIVTFLTQINHRLHASLPANHSASPGPVDPEAVLERGGGSPWEVAWLAVLAFRTLGVAARFVSGYRMFLGKSPSASLHAWCEVFLPGAGWIGLDPAGGLFADEGYLPLAAAPDPLRALPVVGYHEACDEQVSERVEVRVLAAEQEVWPLSPTQWRDLLAVAADVDSALRDDGVGLAVQCSLAFTSARAPELPEWRNAAFGDDKRRVGEELLLRLRERLAPGGLLQIGQGEWFAGEGFPRWRLGCWARSDGVPICRQPARFGSGRRSGELGSVHAERFAQHLATALGVPAERLIPAYEDGLYRRWQAPAVVDKVPDDAELRDPQRRRALAQQLSRGTGELRGYVLPLRWDDKHGGWSSGAWPMRRGAVYLLPGDSPIGYRLPLEGLPLAVQAQRDVDRCQFDDRPLLAETYGEVNARLSRVIEGGAPQPAADGDEPGGPRTAVCVEIRNGRLHCFLPPLSHLEHFLELVAAVEAAAEVMDIGLVLEGYPPPEDHRLRRILVEPDSGALRVQLPPCSDAAELATSVKAAFLVADGCGLRAEHLSPDGSPQALGVGMPVTLGGLQPADSPFLNSPPLLRSLISYWHRHPSLSYLFAGRSIGPSGLAPRVDDGRDEALYELSLALERLPDGDTDAPWLADRVLRHLLTDPAGDMRRAAIRVDELYDPVRPARRLGRVTLGGFEMPPAPELTTLLGVLLRALIVRFLQYPERGALAPWGEALHDRFLLPQQLWEDFRSVLADLAEVGHVLESEWFAPLVERRLPHLGTVRFGDLALELHQAHEPWILLAEEASAAGMARFIDNAADRVQVTATGLTPGRYVLECNGDAVPLQTTGTVGQYVAGVRFKSSNPPATLHPTVPAVAALVFDLIDTWTGAVVGGFTYYPSTPTGWGVPGVPSLAHPYLPGDAAPAPVPVPVVLPEWGGRGRFEAGGSGRRTAQPATPRADASRPYLLDLSFPD